MYVKGGSSGPSPGRRSAWSGEGDSGEAQRSRGNADRGRDVEGRAGAGLPEEPLGMPPGGLFDTDHRRQLMVRVGGRPGIARGAVQSEPVRTWRVRPRARVAEKRTRLAHLQPPCLLEHVATVDASACSGVRDHGARNVPAHGGRRPGILDGETDRVPHDACRPVRHDRQLGPSRSGQDECHQLKEEAATTQHRKHQAERTASGVSLVLADRTVPAPHRAYTFLTAPQVHRSAGTRSSHDTRL